MTYEEILEVLDKYDIKSLDELEYYLDLDGAEDECIDDPVEDKNCTNAKCYEDFFVPDCRKLIEIYNKYFEKDLGNRRHFIDYLVKNTNHSQSSIENYMYCRSCNQQLKKGTQSSLKISNSDFKKDFCNNLNKKFNYITLFENDYTSIKQFLIKEHQVTKDNFEPSFKKKEVSMTQEENRKLFDLIHVPKEELTMNLSNPDNISGSNDYKMNLALAAFDRNLIEESYILVEMLSKEKDFSSNIEFIQLKAKVLSSKNMDKEAIIILEKLVEKLRPNIDTETNNLLAASIKREAFSDYAIYADENILIDKLTKSKDIYYSIYQLNYDYYPALNYMYLVSMLSHINNDSPIQLEQNKKEFQNMWDNVNHVVNDWWSYISEIEFLIILEKYKLAKDKLKTHFEELENIEISDFNVSSTIRQLKLYSNFYTSNDLKEIIIFLENIEK